MTELADVPLRLGRSFDAVVFDFGGVLVTPMARKIAEVAARHGVEPDVLQDVLLGPREESSDHPWHRAERGEVAFADLQAMLAPVAAAAGIAFGGDELKLILNTGFTTVDAVVDRIGALRAAGYRTALLTNSLREFRAGLESMVDFGLFDVVVDSSQVGLRKPEAAIYELVTDRLGVSPGLLIFRAQLVIQIWIAGILLYRLLQKLYAASALPPATERTMCTCPSVTRR